MALRHGTAFLVPSLPGDLTGRLDDVWLQKTAKLLRDSRNYMVVVTEEACGALAAAGSRGEFTFEELGLPDPLTLVAGAPAPWSHRPGPRNSGGGWPATRWPLYSPRTAARDSRRVWRCRSPTRSAPTRTARPPCRPYWIRRSGCRHGSPEPTRRQVPTTGRSCSRLLCRSWRTLVISPSATPRPPSTAGFSPIWNSRPRCGSGARWQISSSGSSWPSPRNLPPLTVIRLPEVLRFRSPRLGAAVLQHTWTWVDGMRPALTGWLRDLGRHPDVEVRARAAASTGLLATLDFSYVLHRFVYPWAVSPSPATRACAALALAVPGHSPRYAPRVWALLRQWAANQPEGPGSRLPWTAAEAAGSAFGRNHPADAISVLGEVLKRDEWDCLVAVAVAVLNLAENGRLGEVLDALLDWSDSMDGSPPVLKALLAFILTARTPALGEADGPPGAPTRAEVPPRAEARIPAAGPPPRPAGSSRLTGTAVMSRAGTSPGPAGAAVSRPAHERGRTIAAERKARPDAGSWPVLLAQSDRHREALRDLWGRALSAKPVRGLALDALRSWLELADQDERRAGDGARVIGPISGLGGKHPDRMDYYLEQWASSPKAPVRSAQRVLNVIGPGEQRDGHGDDIRPDRGGP